MSEFIDPNRWLTVKEAAIYLRYSVVSIRRFVKSGKLKSARAPGHQRSIRIRVEWLDEFMVPTVKEKRIVIKRPVISISEPATGLVAEFQAKVKAARQKRAANQQGN